MVHINEPYLIRKVGLYPSPDIALPDPTPTPSPTGLATKRCTVTFTEPFQDQKWILSTTRTPNIDPGFIRTSWVHSDSSI